MESERMRNLDIPGLGVEFKEGQVLYRTLLKFN